MKVNKNAESKKISAKKFFSCNEQTKKFGVLGWKFFLRDLSDISLMRKIIVGIAGLILIVLGICDFGPHFNQFEWVWNVDAYTTFAKVMKVISGLTSFAGIVYVYMIGVGKISAYTWGIVQISTYGLFAFSAGYTGDAILNIVFLIPFTFVGFRLWRDKMVQGDTVIQSKRMTWKIFAISTLVFVALFVIFWFLIPVADEGLHRGMLNKPGYNYPFDKKLNIWFDGQGYMAHAFDAITNSLYLVATFWMLIRLKEQWIIWIVVNIMQIIMWSGLNGYGLTASMVVMWGVFLVNAVYSLWNWYKNIQVEK